LPITALEALVEISRRTAASPEAEPALHAIAERLAQLVEHDALVVIAAVGEQRTIALTRGALPLDAVPPAIDRAVEVALEGGRALVVAEEYREQAPDGAALSPIERFAILAAPFAPESPVGGALALARRSAGDFQPEEVRIADAFAGLAAASLARARAYQEACARAEALARLQEIGLALNAELDPRRVLERVVVAATSLTGAQFTSVMLLDAEGAPRDYVTDDPLTSHNPLHRAMPFRPGGLTESILKTAQPVVVEDVDHDPRVNPVVQQRGLGALIGLPLHADGAVVGVLWVNFGRPRRFPSEEVVLLTTLAAQASTALRNASLYDEARRLADRDPLTSLVNYRTLQERLRQQMAVARRTGEPLSIVMVDLNDFKHVNDTLGHLAGDTLLRRVAATLVAACRETDTVGRYGGDEFMLILPLTDAAGAQALVARIADQLATLPREGGLARPLTLAAGTATFPSEASEIEALVALADSRLYANKPPPDRRPVVRPIRRSLVRRHGRPAPPR
jgi:diguanylate cyclase (GGDEF)-like protein